MSCHTVGAQYVLNEDKGTQEISDPSISICQWSQIIDNQKGSHKRKRYLERFGEPMPNHCSNEIQV